MSENAPTQPAISSKDLTVRYGPVLALDNFSVSVPRGVVGLLGPNGAGKSTFIKSILGLLEPEKGAIRIAGRDPRTEMEVVRDMVGYMPEHDCLIEHFNAIDFVTYMGRISGMKKDDAMPRGHEVLDFVGIGEERYRVISSYSTGMKQRVKLAQAIVHDPQILFLDEPTNGMDPQGREDMLDLIGKIKASDKSILVSTHILSDIEKVSSRALIISNGRLVTEGDLDVLLAKTEHQKVVKVRGPQTAVGNFVKALGQNYEIRSTTTEDGLATIVFINEGDGSPAFRLSKEHGIQLRAYYPEKATLEDVFIGTLAAQESGQALPRGDGPSNTGTGGGEPDGN